MGKKRIRKIAAIFMCVISAAAMNSSTVFAAGIMDTSKSVTLTISYVHEKQPIPGAEFRLYKVADTDEKTNLTMTSDFAKYPVKLTDLSGDEWQTLALTLSGYAQRDQIKPVCSGKTDANGKLKFPSTASDLKAGLYLVTGAAIKVGDDWFTAKPSMVFLPGYDDGRNTWNYDVTMQPKYGRERNTACKVLKIWSDKGYEQKRPAEITVDLLRDGKIYETVKLTEKNSWRYAWNDLSEQYDWTVAEKEVSGYTVKVEKEGATYTITNTYASNDPPADPPKKPSQVPQTGLLWWPVPILAVCGFAILGMGMIRKKKAANDK